MTAWTVCIRQHPHLILDGSEMGPRGARPHPAAAVTFYLKGLLRGGGNTCFSDGCLVCLSLSGLSQKSAMMPRCQVSQRPPFHLLRTKACGPHEDSHTRGLGGHTVDGQPCVQESRAPVLPWECMESCKNRQGTVWTAGTLPALAQSGESAWLARRNDKPEMGAWSLSRIAQLPWVGE